MEMTSRNRIAANLKTLMDKRADLDTQVKVRKAAGVTQSTVSRLLQASVGPTVDVVDAISEAFGISTLELMACGRELTLLQAWAKMDDLDKDRILAFMEVSASSRSPTGRTSPVSWSSSQPVGGGLHAAVKRASARRLENELDTSQNAKQKDKRSRVVE